MSWAVSIAGFIVGLAARRLWLEWRQVNRIIEAARRKSRKEGT